MKVVMMMMMKKRKRMKQSPRSKAQPPQEIERQKESSKQSACRLSMTTTNPEEDGVFAQSLSSLASISCMHYYVVCERNLRKF